MPGEQSIEQLVRQIRRWRLTLPAILLLEVARPFSFIASQGLLLCQPLLSFFYEEQRLTEYADLLADRSNLEHFIARLERDVPILDGDGKERG